MFVVSIRRSLLASDLAAIRGFSPIRIPPSALSFRIRFLSVQPCADSSTVSFLIESLGLSTETAVSIHRKLGCKNPRNADSVISVLKSHEFSVVQISSMIQRFPSILMVNAERTLLPKLDFFCSKGLSRHLVAELLSRHPYILWRSLEKHLIPTFNFFRTLLESDSKTIKVVRLSFRTGAHETRIAPNVKYLAENGVPLKKIASLLQCHCCVVFADPAKLKKAVHIAKEMGHDPTKVTFFQALNVLIMRKRSIWDSKSRLYEKWGWSNEELISAFKKYPLCMAISEDKINRAMSFFIHEMDWKPSMIAKHPILLSHSLEKRIIPRAAVLKFLLSKGLIKKGGSLVLFIMLSEARFMARMSGFQGKAPELLALYKEELNRLA
ncbi:hypothetical protein SAY87_010858 [Trapa incisa]|uniref:Mitochondrial transcription termination factor family protein n=1 Tax=Trapa incisa TaxID=236973 RepID=A0AAN7JB50_9MYRT|nr:hypothetical protein SAY87_010858 [Trapa incisa]